MFLCVSPPLSNHHTPRTLIHYCCLVENNLVKAHDGDRGINNKIKYSFATRSDRFAINDMTGAVYTRMKLDREEARDDQMGSYALDIVATEISDTRANSVAQTEITIILLDVNDETPTFMSTYYEAEITENVQENAPLTFISNSRNSVIDRDQVRFKRKRERDIFAHHIALRFLYNLLCMNAFGNLHHISTSRF